MKLIALVLGLVLSLTVTQNAFAQLSQKQTNKNQNSSNMFQINKNMLNYDSSTFNSWLDNQVQVSEVKLLEAMSYPDTARGAVIASPSKEKPDYYYHWVRDAGLVMDVVVDLYRKSDDVDYKSYLDQKMSDYINFSISNQQSHP